MLEVDQNTLDDQIEQIIDELLAGQGAVVIRQGFTADEIAEARELIMSYSADEERETHFVGGSMDKVHLQRRVWNLLNKGEIFETMVQHPTVVAITSAFLGDEFILGSIAANRLLPGGPGQEPHIDYPYWDLYKRSSFPARINSSYPLNLQATILLDPFTPESGATAFLPLSQKELTYPDEADRDAFHANAQRMLGDPGDIVLFNGMCWHCAMPNVSDADRSGVLIEYLPKFITPLEDQRSGVRQEVIDRGTPMLRQLMGFDYPYPKLFDEAEAKVQIGRDL
jgi:ectoine hydroxylase-related dioxygenase (phytanoyl-CoA dioxygenase family)